MWFALLLISIIAELALAIPCHEARSKCINYDTCRDALHNYFKDCQDVMRGENYCTEECQHSLIILLSTSEGKALMDCECANDEFCIKTKEQIKICEDEVLEVMDRPIISCRLAEKICWADAECNKAIDYYYRYCKAMIKGKKCTPKCMNSIKILQTRDKAEKLTTCLCNGPKDYKCNKIQRNMEKLCHIHPHSNSSIEQNSDSPNISDQTEVIHISSGSCLERSFSVLLIGLVTFWTR